MGADQFAQETRLLAFRYRTGELDKDKYDDLVNRISICIGRHTPTEQRSPVPPPITRSPRAKKLTSRASVH
jgi:hypothetical protein